MRKITLLFISILSFTYAFAQTESECDDYASTLDSGFDYIIFGETGVSDTISASAFVDYSSNPEVLQKWVHYSSENQNSGPYTAVGITYGPSYLSPDLQAGIWYTLVHMINVENCEIEMGSSVKHNTNSTGRMNGMNFLGQNQNTLDCCFIPEGIEYDSPTISSVDEGIQQITWNVVPEASAYFVEITLIGETEGEAFSTTSDFTTTDTFYTYAADPDVEEIIIRVRSMSTEGNKSLPSEEINIDLTGSMSIDPVEAFASEAKIYPNPSKGKFSIELNSKLSGDANFSIYSTQGRLVDQKSVSLGNNRNIISWKNANLSPGLYFIVIESGEEKKTLKLVVE